MESRAESESVSSGERYRVDAPLVSVIIRTRDRPDLLQEALESVALQSYPHIELIVVNDGGQDVGALVCRYEACVSHVRYLSLEQNRGRPAAANVGLDCATGGYVVFLDDDDLFEAEHIAGLVESLREHPGARAAYTGTRMAWADGDRVWDIEYDPVRLRTFGLFAMHAVMFERCLVEDGCRFDERLNVHEDWDFWLQVAERTDFVHVGQVTAVYRPFGTSGCGPFDFDADRARTAREVLFAKWIPRWSAPQLAAQVELARTLYLGLQERYLALERAQQALVEDHRRLEVYCLDLQQNRLALERESQRAQDYLAVLDRDRHELETEYQRLHARATTLHQDYGELEVENQRVRETLSELDKCYHALQVEYQRLQGAHSGLIQRHASLEHGHSELHRQKSVLEQNLMELHGALRAIESSFGYGVGQRLHSAVQGLRRQARRVVSSARPQRDHAADVSFQRGGDRVLDAPAVTVVGYISSTTGVGEVARGSIVALQDCGHPVSYVNLEWTPGLPISEMPDNADRASRRANLFHVNADAVPGVVSHLGLDLLSGCINIGFWFWELATFPERWASSFEPFDEIWVASQYTQSVLEPVSPIPVLRVRPLVQPAAPADLSRAELGWPDDRFIYYFSFDATSIVERKNPMGLIEAYRRAFGAYSSDTLLIIKMNNRDMVAGNEALLGVEHGFERQIEQAVRDVGGLLLDARYDRATTSALICACDCYVSLHRCEGFGLTMAEAMYFGKPCIATGYSSNLDFMTPDNSRLVGYSLVELERDIGPYSAGSIWADPDVAQAAELMRWVYEQRGAARALGNQAASDMRHWYGSEAVGRAMVDRLATLARGAAVGRRTNSS
ncbi:MAG: glycosyltransferase [Chloroflexi bacterium]|nr:glycosyltransferase [Chloroflexota bacterium]